MQCSQNIKWLVLVSDVSFCFEMFRKSHIVHKVKVLRDCGAPIFHFQNDMSPSHVKSYILFTFYKRANFIQLDIKTFNFMALFNVKSELFISFTEIVKNTIKS